MADSSGPAKPPEKRKASSSQIIGNCRRGHRELRSHRCRTRSLAGGRWRVVRVRPVHTGSGQPRSGPSSEPSEQSSAEGTERERVAREARERDEEAAARTRAVEQRVAELKGCCDRRSHEIPGSASTRSGAVSPCRPWTWASLRFLFRPRSGRTSNLSRHEGSAGCSAVSSSTRLPSSEPGRHSAEAQDDHRRREAQRRRQVAEARRAHQRQVAEAEREVAAHNAHIDELAAGLRENDRFAVSEYIQAVLDRSPYPAGFPAERSAGYVPESSLLAVEWYLPPVDVVPEQKAFRHIKTRKVVEPTARPAAGDQADLSERHRPDRAADTARDLRLYPGAR